MAMGVPKAVWDWSIDSNNDQYTRIIKDAGSSIKGMMLEGWSYRIKLKNDVYASQLAVYLLKCALKEDFIRVGYTTPIKLAQMYSDSWEGSEAYDEYCQRDLVVVDQLTLDNFRDSLKMSVFVGFVRNRIFSQRSVVLVESDNIIFPARFKDLMENNGKMVLIK